MRACCCLISLVAAACAPEPITGDEPLPGEVTGMVTLHCADRPGDLALEDAKHDPFLCSLGNRTGVYVCGDYHIVFATGTDTNFTFYFKDGLLFASTDFVGVPRVRCSSGPETFDAPICSGGNVLPLPACSP